MIRVVTIIVALIAFAGAVGAIVHVQAGLEPALLSAALAFVGAAVLFDLIERERIRASVETRLSRMDRELKALKQAAEKPVIDQQAEPAPSTPEPEKEDAATAAFEMPSLPAPGPEDHTRIKEILRDAVRDDRIVVFAQQMVQLPQRKPVFIELFSRIKTPDGTYLRAAHYVDIAKREDLIGACDNLLLLRAIQMARTLSEGEQPTAIFCNIAAETLLDPSFREEMVDFVAKHREIAERLVLEIDFRDLGQLAQVRQGVLGALADQHVRFSVGQLGGSSPQSAPLDTLPVHFVKMDADALIKLIERDGVEAAAELKTRLDKAGITLVVERIESDKQLVEVLDMNIEIGQGYLFGEPEPLETVHSPKLDRTA